MKFFGFKKVEEMIIQKINEAKTEEDMDQIFEMYDKAEDDYKFNLIASNKLLVICDLLWTRYKQIKEQIREQNNTIPLEEEDHEEVFFKYEGEEAKTAEKPVEEKQSSSKEALKEKAKEEAKDKKFTELLADLSKTQTTKLILTVAKNGRAMQTNISEKTDKLKNMLEVQAGIYGANKSEINNIVDDYKTQLEEKVVQAKVDLVSNAKKMKKEQEAERKNLHNLRNAKKQKRNNYKKVEKSIKNIAKEISKAIIDEDTEKEANLKTELQEKKKMLSGYDANITKYENAVQEARKNQKSLKSTMKQNKKDTKEKLTRNKINEIIEENTGDGKAIAKQNAFGKFVGFFSNLGKKIGGDSAFKRKIVNPIKNEIGKMANGVKSIPGNVKTFTQDFISELKIDMQMAITQNYASIDEIKNTREARRGKEGHSIG